MANLYQLIMAISMIQVHLTEHKLNVTLWIVQNYTAGNPASVLYLKNLAKDVVPEDFYFIFGETKCLHSFFT